MIPLNSNGDNFKQQKLQKYNKWYNANKKYEYNFHFSHKLMKYLSKIKQKRLTTLWPYSIETYFFIIVRDIIKWIFWVDIF